MYIGGVLTYIEGVRVCDRVKEGRVESVYVVLVCFWSLLERMSYEEEDTCHIRRRIHVLLVASGEHGAQGVHAL
jgi:hypothetical protein